MNQNLQDQTPNQKKRVIPLGVHIQDDDLGPGGLDEGPERVFAHLRHLSDGRPSDLQARPHRHDPVRLTPTILPFGNHSSQSPRLIRGSEEGSNEATGACRRRRRRRRPERRRRERDLERHWRQQESGGV